MRFVYLAIYNYLEEKENPLELTIINYILNHISCINYVKNELYI